MSSEVYNLVTLDVDKTVTRGARVSFKNSPTTPPLIAVADADLCCTGANYLVRSSLEGNNLKGYAKFNKNSSLVENVTGIEGITGGDIIRNDSDNTFYTVTGIQGDSLYLTSRYQGDTSEGPATLRKVRLGSAKFEYLKSYQDDNTLVYNQADQVWEPLGIEMKGPVETSSSVLKPFSGDELGIQFQKSENPNEPDLATVKSVYKTLVSRTQREIQDLSLSPIPYPHESLKVYFGPDGNVELKEEGKDYVVNYSSNPTLLSSHPPFEDRQVAYIKFLEELDNTTQIESLAGNFPGSFSIIKRDVIPGSDDLVTPIQDIISGTEDIKVGGETQTRYKDYDIDYPSGNVTFIEHQNSELLIDNITFPTNLIWDGVSIIRGVTKDKVEDESNLIIPPVTGLPGISETLYFEDNDSRALVKNADYILEYNSGAISIETDLEEGSALLLSYFVEGEDQEKEDLPLTNIRTDKFPIQPDTLTLIKKWRNSETQKTGTTVLVEGVDYEIFYLTGKIRLLRTIEGEEIRSLQATYTPLTQINAIIQPTGSPGFYQFTLVDDILDNVDVSNLRFLVRNPSVSIASEDPFKDAGDPDRYSFENDIEQITAVKIRGKEEFNVEDISYDPKTKEIQLGKSQNAEITMEQYDVALATYRYTSDTVPYAPVIPFFPIFAEGSDSFVIEGFDKTDVIRTGMVIRIDNFDPENTYYFKVKSISYDGDNTTVTISGIFPENITNPTFFLFDDFITWESLPSGTLVDRTSLIGSTQLRFKNNPLSVLNQMRNDKILMINDSFIHTILSAEVDESDPDIINVSVFPALQDAPSGTVVVSNTPVYSEGDTDLFAEYPVLDDPAEPAFRISYNAPEGYEGSGTIAVDTEKIILRENVEGNVNPNSYEYKFSDYSNIRELAEAIDDTQSTFPSINSKIPSYRPFTFNPDGVEEYYLPSNNYSADLVIPFEEGEKENLPYMITVTPELFKWKLVSAYKNREYFEVEDRDRTDLFSSGALIAFKTRDTGTDYFYEVKESEYDDSSDPAKTKVTIKGTFSDNLINPYIYRYARPSWRNVVTDIVSIDRDNSIVIFSGDISRTVKVNTLVRFGSTYVYSINKIEVISGNTLAYLEPNIDLNVRDEKFFNYVEFSDVPVILDGVTRQPNFTITYKAPSGYVGKGYVEITDDFLKLTEVLDGSKSADKEFKFSDYNDLNQLVADIDSFDDFNIPGYSPFSADASAYEEELEAGKLETFSLAETPKTEVSYNVKIAKSTFEITYTSPVGYSNTAKIEFYSDQMKVIESGSGSDIKTSTITFVGKSIYDIVSEIQDIESLVPGNNPFSVDLKNTEEFVGRGDPGKYQVAGNPEKVTLDNPYRVKCIVFEDWWSQLIRINENRLVENNDYTIEGGSVVLSDTVEKGDRFRISYMGLDTLPQSGGEAITCSCRFISVLPEGYRVDVYMDYLNIDQFYLQTLTERFFLEIVTAPQVEQLLRTKTGGGGNGADTGDSGEIPVYEGGAVNSQYRLRDEQIKKELYLKIFEWYKQRRRNFTSEAQLIMGFKYGNCPHVAYQDGRFTLSDSAVEGPQYSMITNSDIEQINNDSSRFFPLGYDGSAPVYIDRLGDKYISYNEVYPYNVRYVFEDGSPDVLEGRVKSVNPYWTQNLDFEILQNESNTIVAPYNMPFEEYDRTFFSDDKKTNFLKRISVGDKFRIEGKKNRYTIGKIEVGKDSRVGGTYEVLVMEDGKYFTESGIQTIAIQVKEDGRKVREEVVKEFFGDQVKTKSFSEFESFYAGEGYKLEVQTFNPAFFPAYDDNFNLGVKIEGKDIDGKVPNKNQIKKFGRFNFFAALFALVPGEYDPAENFRLQAGHLDEDSLTFVPEETITVNIADLNYFQERNVINVQDALYKNTDGDADDNDKPGLSKYFYLSLERVYVAGSEEGYVEGFVLRSRDKNKVFRFLLEDGLDVADQYGYRDIDETTGNSIVYENFYDPNNIYRWLLKEQQAWLTEEAIIRDVFDVSDKIGRAFEAAILNGSISGFKDDLISISNVLDVRIPRYMDHLLFLTGMTSEQGPIERTMEEVIISETGELSFASPAIKESYEDAAGKTGTKGAIQVYQDFLNEQNLAISVNASNRSIWITDYIRWVLSLNEGTVFQKEARRQYDLLRQDIDIGFLSFDAVSLRYNQNPEAYLLSNPKYGVYSYSNSGPSLVLQVEADSVSNSEDQGVRTFVFPFREHTTLSSLISAVNSQAKVGNEQLFSAQLIFAHYPKGNYTTQRLVYTDGLLSIDDDTVSIQASNVSDHRKNDSRVLFLDKRREQRLILDNDDSTAIEPFPTYVSNGDPNKKFIDDLNIKVPGRWARVPEDFPEGYFDVLKIGPYNSNWSISYTFEDTYKDGTTRDDITTPEDVIDRYNEQSRVDIDKDTWEVLLSRGNKSRPETFLLKKLIITKKGVTSFDEEFDLRRYEDISSLVTAINSAKDDQGNRLFKAEVVGEENIQGRMKSYELKADYERQILKVLVGVDVDTTDTESVQYYLRDFPVGWKVATVELDPGQTATIEINPKRYSLLENYAFLPEPPEQARDTALSNQKIDILPFDLYTWAENGSYKIEYEVSGDTVIKNSLILSSDRGTCTIPLKEEELLYDYSGDGKGLINRINRNPDCNRYWYANLKFGRKGKNNFVYTYLPKTKSTSVPKASLEDLYLDKDSALTIESDGINFEYQVVPTDTLPSPIDLDTVYESKQLNLEADIGAIRLSFGDGYTNSTQGTYTIDGTAETLSFSVSYEYDYEYSVSFNLSSYTLDDLKDAINGERDPVTNTDLFNASRGVGVPESEPASKLVVQSGDLPGTLLKSDSPSEAIVISLLPPDPSYTVRSARYSVSPGGTLTLQATLRYTGTFNPPAFNLLSASYGTLQNLTEAIGDLKPDSAFNSIFNAELLIPDDDSTDLLDSGGAQALGEFSYLRLQSVKSYDITNITLNGLVSSINNDADSTGFTATAVEGYGTYPAKYLVPSSTAQTADESIELVIDLRNQTGLRLLNMDTPASYEVSGTGLNKSLTVNKDNKTKVFKLTTKQLNTIRDNLSGSVLSGLQEIGIYPILLESNQFGLLNNVDSNDLPINAPPSSGAHVYFGFLSDIRFYQISDKNLDAQLSYIKRRLAKPWKDSEGNFIPDYYNSDNYYDFEYGISRDQFLSFLRDTRFTQLANSIINEELNNKAYLWLYLKFHREFGCDQQVKVLTKQIEEDEESGNQLGIAPISGE